MWVMNAHNVPAGLRLFISCFIAWCIAYGATCVVIQLVTHWFVTLAVTSITFIFIKRYGLPRPDVDAVDSTLGRLERTGILSKPVIQLWAHRFAGNDAPENTVEAMELSMKNGAKGVEFDLFMTSDFVAVVVHESNLKRIVGLDDDIRIMPWAVVQTLKILTEERFGNEYKNLRIPKFDDVIERCLRYKVRAIIDVKDDRQEMVAKILSTYRTHPDLYKLACITSFDPLLIWRIRKEDPRIVGSLAWSPGLFTHHEFSMHSDQLLPHPRSALLNFWFHLINLAVSFWFHFFIEDILGVSAVLLHKDSISASDVTAWQQRRVRVIAWTVNDAVEKRYFLESLGIAVITDTLKG